jgi:hypothetical protein
LAVLRLVPNICRGCHVGAEAGHCQWSLGIQSAAKASASTCLYITLIPPCCLDVSGAPKELVLQHAAQDWSRVVSLSLLSSNRHGHSQWFHNWYSGSGWWKVPSLISKLCRFLARLFRSLVMLAGAQKSYRHKQVRSGQSQAQRSWSHMISSINLFANAIGIGSCSKHGSQNRDVISWTGAIKGVCSVEQGLNCKIKLSRSKTRSIHDQVWVGSRQRSRQIILRFSFSCWYRISSKECHQNIQSLRSCVAGQY